MTDGRQHGSDKGAARRNGLVAASLALVGVTMVGAAFAAVPLYQWFCKTTGFGGTTQVAVAAPGEIIDRAFTVEFDANVQGDLPWRFRPDQKEVTLKAGEIATISYTIENLSDRPTAAMAAYNVNPEFTGAYFNKIACFCFNEQKLAPHEKITVPVTFFVDPKIDADVKLKQLKIITLSYTFFERPEDEPGAGQPAAPRS
jgi:cytochrome c oxidase assembly protein subunit 11